MPSGFDVEALLEETANEYRLNPPAKNGDRHDDPPEARITSAKTRDRDLLDSGRSKRNGDDARSEAGSVRSPRHRRNTSSQPDDRDHRDRDRRRRRGDEDDRHYRPSGGRRGMLGSSKTSSTVSTGRI